MKTSTSLLALSVLALAFTQAAQAEPLVKVFKSRGIKQCEPNSGTPPQGMSGALESAGIPVSSTACGDDGQLHGEACGATTGAINIFEIPGSQAEAADRLGFKSLATLPEGTEIPCPD